MGQLAFLKAFILVSVPIDANDNRRHFHVFRKGQRHLKSIAKIWIESNGEKCVEIAESTLTSKENRELTEALKGIGTLSTNKLQRHSGVKRQNHKILKNKKIGE